MKRSDSTEMERLLRRYARRDGEALRAAHDATTEANIGAHLDADEMNAYAEGALPEAARSRYFAHLADCDDCRTLVTELTLAASREDEGRARVASLETTPSKSWRERLAVIFSPPVLRYGVPALALFAVIIVAIVAMRTNRKESGVALNVEQSRYSPSEATTAPNPAAAANTATGTAESHSSSNVAPLNDQQSPALPGAPAATPIPSQPAPMADAAPVLSKSTTQSETAQPNDTKVTEGEFGILTRREQQEVAAATTAAPPPPAAPKATGMAATVGNEADNRDKSEEERKNKVAGKDDNDEMVADGSVSGGTVARKREANGNRQDVGRTAASRAAQNEQRKRPMNAPKSGPAATDMITEKESSAETRSAGGRKFRRQGGAWVDTAYNSGSTTNVARGSEQYRALVADEPALRTITEQLSGVVIVVWKRRTYRFY